MWSTYLLALPVSVWVFLGVFSQLTSFFLLLAANENSVEPVVGCISILYVLEVEWKPAMAVESEGLNCRGD